MSQLTSTAPTPSHPLPSAWQLLRIWTSIGLQSFGGGASTTLLIQRTFIERYGWLTDDEFSRLWNLCLLAPGINLIAVSVLIGKKLAGRWGIVASVVGLLVPSAAITCLIAVLFAQVRQTPAAQAILRGVVPATAGIMGLVMFNFARPIVRARTTGGPFYLWGALALAVVLALVLILWNVSAVVIVLAAVLLGTLFFVPRQAPARTDAGAPTQQPEAGAPR